MLVSLLQRLSEVELGRKTILLNGVQCGYLQMAARHVDFTDYLRPDQAAQIVAEVERLEGIKVVRQIMPEPTPPEWTQAESQDEEARPSIIIP